MTTPAQTLGRVCEFVGEAYDERMLDYHTRAGASVEREPWKSGATKPLYTSSLHSCRSELSDRQVLLIELITRKEMQQYGYPKSKFSWNGALLAPPQLAREAVRWFARRRAERKQRCREEIIVDGDQRRLLRCCGGSWSASR